MMKKLIFVTLLTLISMTAFTQVRFGVKSGVNLASLIGDDFEKTDIRTSGVFGVFVKFNLSKFIEFQPEILYSMQGAKISTSFDSWTGGKYGVDEAFKLEFINIPLMMKFFIINGLSIQVGPQVGFLSSAKYNAKSWSTAESHTIYEKGNHYEFKGIDFGFNFGFGYDLKMGLGVDLRYNLGLRPIADYHYDDAEADGKNRMLQCTASYAF